MIIKIILQRTISVFGSYPVKERHKNTQETEQQNLIPVSQQSEVRKCSLAQVQLPK